MQVVGWTSEIKGNFVFFNLKLFGSLKERKIDQNQFLTFKNNCYRNIFCVRYKYAFSILIYTVL